MISFHSLEDGAVKRKFRDLAKKDVGRTYTSISRIGQRTERQRPEVRLLNDARKRYKGLLEQFGMTPSFRTRVTSKTDDPEDELEEWKRKHATG